MKEVIGWVAAGAQISLPPWEGDEADIWDYLTDL